MTNTNSITDNLSDIQARIEKAASISGRKWQDITLLAVSKGQNSTAILQAKSLGLTVFGENKIQEALPKITELGGGLEWHMIGHLQSNKVAEAVANFQMIQSVDSVRLAQKINEEASKLNKTMNVLLEINASGEDQKYGFSPDEIYVALDEIGKLSNIAVKGVMGMAPNSPDSQVRRATFKKLKSIFSVCKSVKKQNIQMQILSMGMSDDFETAIEEGSTMIRIGRSLFGER